MKTNKEITLQQNDINVLSKVLESANLEILLLREENESLKREVREFAEWCGEECWIFNGNRWAKDSAFDFETKTTKELYTLYKQK
jgi:hypothetical protein